MNHTLEILAPAGDEEMLRAAVFSGADSVYLGLRGFNARRGAANFDGKALAAAVAFCHARNCKVYAAVNTLVFPEKEEELRAAIDMVAAAGCDAVIVQDLLVAKYALEARPQLQVHASTQMSVHSLAGVQRLAEMGFSRAILARELSGREIEAIAKESPIELEVFVHGALCVSVSGQCYASAFLGGRSANRGGCAGPCRLPFAARADAEECGAVFAGGELPSCRPASNKFNLSLKDLSVLDVLPRLEAMGVVSAKIEGRLRGPEYCAAVVDASRKALEGESYDKEFLRDVFSRSGFTDGWFSGENGGDMFGVRTEADAGASKAALPKARELYRRERPRVPVQMHLHLQEDGATLTVGDGVAAVKKQIGGPLPAAQKDAAPALAEALAKTGGTPFYLARPPAVEANGFFLAAGQASALRRQALEEMLQKREVPGYGRSAIVGGGELLAVGSGVIAGNGVGHSRDEEPTGGAGFGTNVSAEPRESAARATGEAAPGAAAVGQGLAAMPMDAPRSTHSRCRPGNSGAPALRGRFASLAQLPEEAAELCQSLLLPLWQARQVPPDLRAKTWLWLPRVLFGKAEEKARRAVDESRELGFAGYEANNLAHYKLLEGLPVSAGFGMNPTNRWSLATAALNGCVAATLSPELTLRQMRAICENPAPGAPIATDALCYGHLPLFLTRACPLKIEGGCAACPKAGVLVDRKGERMPLLCEGDVRSVHNPKPLWMAERLAELPTDTATLYFTGESREKAARVLRAFADRQPAAGAFTRGLYARGTQD